MKRGSLAAVAAISLLLAACGDDDTESSGAEATEPAAAEATSPPADATGAGRGDYGPAESEASPPATDAPAGDPASGDAEIVISGFAFSEDITVAVGTTVVVRNDDSAGHTWTADDGAFDSGFIDAGGTFEFTFTEAGTFAFHCEVHPAMTGTITVTA
jgi:plastocyanin